MNSKQAFGWLDLLTGLLFLGLGIVLLLHPKVALTGLIVLMGVGAILSGISDIILYTRMRKYVAFESSASLITGIISALAGVLILLNPVIGQWILNIVFPIWFIVRCFSRIAEYDFIRRTTGKAASALLVGLSILGMLLGIIMMFNSRLFTMSLGGLIAVNLIILGASDLIGAFGSRAESRKVHAVNKQQY